MSCDPDLERRFSDGLEHALALSPDIKNTKRSATAENEKGDITGLHLAAMNVLARHAKRLIKTAFLDWESADEIRRF